MSFGNGEGSHSEMGRENSMTCRAKTYGNSFTEEGQKEKMEGSGTCLYYPSSLGGAP
jgi:hypothetical protein